MHVWRILLGIVIDQVLVLVLEIPLKGFVWPDDFPKEFDLERIIQQIMLQAKLAESSDCKLDVIIYRELRLIAIPGRFEPAGKLRVRKTYNGGLVKIIQKLTEESVSGESDRGEMTAVDQRIGNLCHVVLGGLEC